MKISNTINKKAMKTITKFCAAILFLSSCSSMQQTASTSNDDDIYASSKHPVQPVNENKPITAAPQQNATNADQSRVSQGDDNKQATNLLSTEYQFTSLSYV